MRWSIRIGAAFLVLLAAYTVWPFVDLYRLARAIERRDVAEIAARVEFRMLRPSVTRQVLATYMKITGKEERLGGFGRDAVITFGAAMAQPALADLASSERVIALFVDGWPTILETAAGRPSSSLMRLRIRDIWRLYASSEYRGPNFSVSAPPDAQPAQKFRIHLKLIQWTWKLYDVELPEALRVKLAKDMARAIDKK